MAREEEEEDGKGEDDEAGGLQQPKPQRRKTRHRRDQGRKLDPESQVEPEHEGNNVAKEPEDDVDKNVDKIEEDKPMNEGLGRVAYSMEVIHHNIVVKYKLSI